MTPTLDLLDIVGLGDDLTHQALDSLNLTLCGQTLPITRDYHFGDTGNHCPGCDTAASHANQVLDATTAGDLAAASLLRVSAGAYLAAAETLDPTPPSTGNDDVDWEARATASRDAIACGLASHQ